MSQTVISVENLYKEYKLGVISHGTLTHDLQSWWARVRGKDDPNSLISAHHKADAEKDSFLALNDVSFDVKQGDRVGIIGRNGAGKSTLLKILSKITSPTSGQVKIKGRVGSLLEVGTGFHSELTGRENIYLNGAILGMSKKEIDKKLDEIIDFSGVEKHIDTPVKRYSSGMNVRLGFAVAAHLEPEILIVDEVLSVGDAEFQKKAIGKMEDVSKGEGRTILFVSHNMGAVTKLCNVGYFLNSGCILSEGDIQDVVSKYVNYGIEKQNNEWFGIAGDNDVKLLHTWVKPIGVEENSFVTDVDIEVGVQIEILKPIVGLILGFTLWSEYGYELAYVLYDDEETDIKQVEKGISEKKFIIPKNTLAHGGYAIEFDVGIHMQKKIISQEGKLNFNLDNISGLGRNFSIVNIRGRSGIFRPLWREKALLHE